MIKVALCMVLLALGCSSAHAEIEVVGTDCEGGVCLIFWPQLTAIPGWHYDEAFSPRASVYALAQDGHSFEDSETVIYARAIRKSEVPEIESLQHLIVHDRMQFAENSPDISIRESGLLVSGDGEQWKTFAFVPAKAGNWEQVTYGEDEEFFLVFTISSKSEQGYRDNLVAYVQIIGAYKH